jgi:hypothetical protein
MKINWLILSFILVSVCACSSSPKVDSLSFSDSLEISVDSLVESDAEKKQIMEFYTRLGGAEASEKRAKKACEALENGEDIEKLSINLNHLDEPFEALGLASPHGDSEWEKLKLSGKLYLSEVYTAQAVFCPDTKAELDF